MSARQVIELSCNEPGCKIAIATGQRRVCDARAEAAAFGNWTSVLAPRPTNQGPLITLDYCPDHGPGALR